MRAVERAFVRFTMLLCTVFEVSPQQLEKLLRKKQLPPPPEKKDYLEA